MTGTDEVMTMSMSRFRRTGSLEERRLRNFRARVPEWPSPAGTGRHSGPEIPGHWDWHGIPYL